MTLTESTSGFTLGSHWLAIHAAGWGGMRQVLEGEQLTNGLVIVKAIAA